MVDLRLLSKPVGFVISPTLLPSRILKFEALRTSKPVLIFRETPVRGSARRINGIINFRNFIIVINLN